MLLLVRQHVLLCMRTYVCMGLLAYCTLHLTLFVCMYMSIHLLYVCTYVPACWQLVHWFPAVSSVLLPHDLWPSPIVCAQPHKHICSTQYCMQCYSPCTDTWDAIQIRKATLNMNLDSGLLLPMVWNPILPTTPPPTHTHHLAPFCLVNAWSLFCLCSFVYLVNIACLYSLL